MDAKVFRTTHSLHYFFVKKTSSHGSGIPSPMSLSQWNGYRHLNIWFCERLNLFDTRLFRLRTFKMRHRVAFYCISDNFHLCCTFKHTPQSHHAFTSVHIQRPKPHWTMYFVNKKSRENVIATLSGHRVLQWFIEHYFLHIRFQWL